MLQRLLGRGGSFASPLWKASQIDTPDVNAKPVTPEVHRDQNGNVVPPPAYRPGEAPVRPAPAPTPMPPVQGLDLPWMPPMPRSRPPEAPMAPPAAPAAAEAVPMPQARPDAAPQDTSFFMRNALQMQDPMGGGFIDPTGAASVSGPDLIQKMMKYLHSK